MKARDNSTAGYNVMFPDDRVKRKSLVDGGKTLAMPKWLLPSPSSGSTGVRTKELLSISAVELIVIDEG